MNSNLICFATTWTYSDRINVIPIEVPSDSLGFITIFSTLVAFAAVCISAWQLHWQRIHNRQSLRPVLCFEQYGTKQDWKMCLELQNHGPGPAFIDNVEFSYKEIQNLLWSNSTVSYALAFNQIHPKTVVIRDFSDDSTIPADTSIPILKLHDIWKDDAKADKISAIFLQFIRELKITVKYRDIYGKQSIKDCMWDQNPLPKPITFNKNDRNEDYFKERLKRMSDEERLNREA